MFPLLLLLLSIDPIVRIFMFGCVRYVRVFVIGNQKHNLIFPFGEKWPIHIFVTLRYVLLPMGRFRNGARG